MFQLASEQRDTAKAPKGSDRVRHRSPFTPSTHLLSASSIRSRKNCCRFLKSRGCLSLLITSKSVKVCPSSSKISERRSSAIRFVHDFKPDVFLDINEDSRWRLKIRDSDR